MKKERKPPADIDGYIGLFGKDVREILQKIRSLIRKNAPDAEETVVYGIPTFRLKGNLVHFAAFTHHIGFYPTPSGIEAFKAEIAGYEHAKGTVRFPLDKPIPYDLIERIVKFRVNEVKNRKK